jgi:hypothetical protein
MPFPSGFPVIHPLRSDEGPGVDQPPSPPGSPTTQPAEPVTPPRPVVPPPPPPVAGSGGSGRSRLPIALAVALVLVLAMTGAGVALRTGDSSTSPGGGPTKPPSAAPVDLTAHVRSFEVLLAWKQGALPAEVWYRIVRNGKRVDVVPVTTFAWTDMEAQPGSLYTYEVVAVGKSNEASAEVSIKTPVARPATARLEGLFRVRLDPTSHYGFSRFGSTPKLAWWFTPKCTSGACDTRLDQSLSVEFTALLRKRGSAYRGVFTWHGRTTCGGTSVFTAVTVDLHATKAEVADGKWRVTQIEGTMSELSPQQLGCVASGALYDLVGPLVP